MAKADKKKRRYIMAQLDAQSIINFIGSAPKKTFVKVYVKGKNLDSLTYPEGVDAFVESRTGILFGDWKEVKPFLDEHAKDFDAVRIENEARNSAVPLLDTKNINARIEPGAVIRRSGTDRKQCRHHDGSYHQHRS